MNKIVEELKKVGTFYIATMDGDQPRVRPFGSICELKVKFISALAIQKIVINK